MKIGDVDLELVRPENLDQQLVALTGCRAVEVHAQLANAAIADHVAAALLPFLNEPPARHLLAQAIADAGVVSVRSEVRQLYADYLGIKPEVIVQMPKREARRGRSKA